MTEARKNRTGRVNLETRVGPLTGQLRSLSFESWIAIERIKFLGFIRRAVLAWGRPKRLGAQACMRQ
jgi:C4-dicarboxylate-specific signal transduction histidine kinase